MRAQRRRRDQIDAVSRIPVVHHSTLRRRRHRHDPDHGADSLLGITASSGRRSRAPGAAGTGRLQRNGRAGALRRLLGFAPCSRTKADRVTRPSGRGWSPVELLADTSDRESTNRHELVDPPGDVDALDRAARLPLLRTSRRRARDRPRAVGVGPDVRRVLAPSSISSR